MPLDVPSPKLQSYETMCPSASDEPEPLNETVLVGLVAQRPIVGNVCVDPASATGGIPDKILKVLETTPVKPSSSVTVRKTVNVAASE